MATLEPLHRELATARETIAGLSQENEDLVREVQSLFGENSEIMSHLEAEVLKNDTLALKINRLVEERHKFGIKEMIKLFTDENKLNKIISHLRQV
jgi:ParB-like chromosome segregation protein Spo0J